MERANRFIWELSCDERDRALVEQALQTLALVVKHTDNLALLTGGERRYGLRLFEICHSVIRTGLRGRPRQTLPEGIRVRLKNKGPKRHKYETPHPEHPDTPLPLLEPEIHANHLEGFNAALRRRAACYQRKTNTDAKKHAPPMSAECVLAPA